MLLPIERHKLRRSVDQNAPIVECSVAVIVAKHFAVLVVSTLLQLGGILVERHIGAAIARVNISKKFFKMREILNRLILPKFQKNFTNSQYKVHCRALPSPHRADRLVA